MIQKQGVRLVEVWQCVEQFDMLQPGDRVLVGVSGGPDSVALLHLLHSRQAHYGIELFVVHVNHQLRPEAEQEAAYVEQLCKWWQIPVRLFTVNVAALAAQKGMSLEQAGHEARFACFAEAGQAWQTTKLALGHHRDDRAESLLLHLIQGCGLDGLVAMPPREGQLIRPLAQVSKGQLMAYCQAQGLQYFIDSTNLEPDCLRNQIRLELLPQLRRYNPQITDALLRLQETGGADAQYLEQCVAELWQQYGTAKDGQVQFPAEVFRAQHLALQRRLLRLLYRTLTGADADLRLSHVEQMRRLALGTHGSQQVSLPGGVIFFRRYQQIGAAWVRPAATPYCYRWDLTQPFIVEEWNCHFTVRFLDEADHFAAADGDPQAGQVYQAALDAGKLAGVLEIRSRQPGDVLQLAGMQGHKKLKDFFIDRKVPQPQRDRIPLVVADGEIIWIPGLFVSGRVRATETTEQICLLQCFRK